MKVWYFPAEVYGDGGIRLKGDYIEVVTDPDKADVLVLPQCLFVLMRNQALWERFWQEKLVLSRPRNVVIYDCSDDWKQETDSAHVPPVQGCIFFKCGATFQHQTLYPSLICWPWPVPDLGVWRDHYKDQKKDKFFSFVGWKTPLAVTTEALRAVSAVNEVHGRLPYDIVQWDDFHGGREPKAGNHRPGDPPNDPETARREKMYRDSLFSSFAALAPESIIGVPRYRFFEAMSAGVMPVLIQSETGPQALPRHREVEWDSVAWVGSLDQFKEDLVAGYFTTEIAASKGRLARIAYETFLHKDKFEYEMTRVVASGLVHGY